MKRRLPVIPPPANTSSGLNGAMPQVYDPDWQRYTDLSPTQVEWFRAQPEWANFLALVALSPKTAAAGIPPAAVDAALAVAGQPLTSIPHHLIGK